MTESLFEVIPTGGNEFEHRRAEGDSLIAKCVAFIHETGDMQFSSRLWDALQLLPNVSAHHQHVLHADHLFAEVPIDVELAEARERMFRIIHRDPLFVRSGNSMPQRGEA